MALSSFWKAVLTASVLAIEAGRAIGQTAPAQPYAGLQARDIKALSPAQIAQLRAGEGMGLALAAELNGYPGPRHVLDLGAQLGLTDAQRARVRQLSDAMKAEAVPLGQKLIAAERDLDIAFADRTMTPERLQAATAAIGELQGKLRDTHLKYHLATAALLTTDQIHRYTELRGYTAVAGAPGVPGGALSPIAGAMHHHMMQTIQHGE